MTTRKHGQHHRQRAQTAGDLTRFEPPRWCNRTGPLAHPECQGTSGSKAAVRSDYPPVSVQPEHRAGPTTKTAPPLPTSRFLKAERGPVAASSPL